MSRGTTVPSLTAADLDKLDLGDLTHWMRKPSHHQLGQARADALQAAAVDSRCGRDLRPSAIFGSMRPTAIS